MVRAVLTAAVLESVVSTTVSVLHCFVTSVSKQAILTLSDTLLAQQVRGRKERFGGVLTPKKTKKTKKNQKKPSQFTNFGVATGFFWFFLGFFGFFWFFFWYFLVFLGMTFQP